MSCFYPFFSPLQSVHPLWGGGGGEEEKVLVFSPMGKDGKMLGASFIFLTFSPVPLLPSQVKGENVKGGKGKREKKKNREKPGRSKERRL